MTSTVDRRCFLRAGLTALILPRLPSLLRGAVELTPPRRLLFFGSHLGFHPDHFFPKQSGSDYEVPITLEPLRSRRNACTVFSNLGHPGVTGGHDGVYTLLSGVTKETASRYPEKNVSMDQVAARHAGPSTRHRSILTGLGPGTEMSWDRTGICVRPTNDPAYLFRILFENMGQVANSEQRTEMTTELSILDALVESAKAMRRSLGSQDRGTLDQYLTSIREVELELKRTRRWIGTPKPGAHIDPIPAEERRQTDDLALFMKLLVLALQTDSTRVGTVEIPLTFPVHEIGIGTSYHKISHHGQVPELLEHLQTADTFFLQKFAALLGDLAGAAAEDNSSLLDHCLVVLAGGLGDANTHKNQDLPILLAGGGLEHRGHVVCPAGPAARVPLCNLWLSLLQWFGVEIDRFGTSTGTFSPMVIR